MNVLITGAAGYLGSQLVRFLLANSAHHIIAADIRDASPFEQNERLTYVTLDVRDEQAAALFQQHQVETVVHLASIVTPGKNSNREFEYSVDVIGTKNILQACVASDVKRIIVSSSGAAYGYYADNAAWLTEEHAVRGNEKFAYSYHKRLVEEMLATYRNEHPQLEQTIFRIGTIMGESVNNQITNLFEQKMIYGIAGSESPFVFIWDQDVVACFAKAIDHDKTGIYNVAGDGALTVDEIGILLNKRVLKIPPSLVYGGMFAMKRLRISQYGEEQMDFLRYRPVLLNTKLKEEFGYIPQKTSLQAFETYLFSRAQRKQIEQLTT